MNLAGKRVAIIGGGITGLSAAQRITATAPEIGLTLYEASDRLGGVIQSTEQDGFLFEHSADSFIVSDELPCAGQLCEQLRVDLIPTAEQHRGALILRDGVFHSVPDGLQLLSVRKLVSMLSSPLLSWRGKLRVASERFIPRKSDDQEESLQQFATRRLGHEMFDRIVQPLVSGIYTADPQKLSVAAALPQFVAQEKKYGSLARAAVANPSARDDRGARYSLFRSPRNGMEQLIAALERQLDSTSICKSTRVRSIRKSNDGWEVVVNEQQIESFHAIICSTPAGVVAKLVDDVSCQLAASFDSIEHVTTAVVCLGYRRSQVAHPLNAFGCVIPAIENRQILAVSFTNIKFPARAPQDHILLRVFLGGALQPELAELEDNALMSTATKELSDLLGVHGSPVTSKIIRWPKTTPQYHIGHQKRIAEIERIVKELPGIEVAGNAFRGVGIPQCIKSGWEAADRAMAGMR